MDEIHPNKMNDDPQNTKQQFTNPILYKLHDQLDSLWTVYLHHLDAYTSAQTVLQKHMSAGFLSLARANFDSRSHVRRYGQDYYHDRAVATRRVNISLEDGTSKPSLGVIQWSQPPTEPEIDSETLVEVERTGENEQDVKQLPSPPGTPEREPPETDAKEDATPSEKRNQVPLQSDPLKWFGILVPQALRSSQASFCGAVDEAVVDAVNAAKGMRSTETEIRKLRKEILKAEKERSIDV